jgi:hypothetical protein
MARSSKQFQEKWMPVFRSGIAITITYGFDGLAGLLKTQFQARILTLSKRPALA